MWNNSFPAKGYIESVSILQNLWDAIWTFYLIISYFTARVQQLVVLRLLTVELNLEKSLEENFAKGSETWLRMLALVSDATQPHFSVTPQTLNSFGALWYIPAIRHCCLAGWASCSVCFLLCLLFAYCPWFHGEGQVANGCHHGFPLSPSLWELTLMWYDSEGCLSKEPPICPCHRGPAPLCSCFCHHVPFSSSMILPLPSLVVTLPPLSRPNTDTIHGQRWLKHRFLREKALGPNWSGTVKGCW